jgi:calmodulin-regulated spectrin-associated protein
MTVIEALMILYAKEVTSGDKIQSAISRISGGQIPPGLNYEQLLLFWISHVCAALKKRVDQEIKMGMEYLDEAGKRIPSPDIPTLHDYTNLCDGVCLAYLISYYCPKILPWTSVRISYLPTVEVSAGKTAIIYGNSKNCYNF